jgi:hypothetical protein
MTNSEGDLHLVVMQGIQARISGLPVDTWLSVERFADERIARARFQYIRAASQALDAGIVLMRAKPSQSRGAVVHLHTLVSSNAELAQVYLIDIARASSRQKEAWSDAIETAAQRLRNESVALLGKRIRARKKPRSALAWSLFGGLVALVFTLIVREVSIAQDGYAARSRFQEPSGNQNSQARSLSEGINRTFGAVR